MHIDVDSIVKKIDIEKLIEEMVESEIAKYIDMENIIDDVIEDERFKAFVYNRVMDIIDVYMSSDDGRQCIIEKFKDTVTDSDMLIDNKITDVIIEFLKKSLVTRY